MSMIWGLKDMTASRPVVSWPLVLSLMVTASCWFWGMEREESDQEREADWAKAVEVEKLRRVKAEKHSSRKEEKLGNLEVLINLITLNKILLKKLENGNFRWFSKARV